MRQRGFTLVELVVVIGIIAILLSIATLNYSTMQKKAAIEQEVTTIYGNLMDVRLQALYTKTGRTVTISGKQFNIYSSQVTSVAPVSIVSLTYPVVMNINSVIFDSSGMMLSQERSVCVDPTGSLATNPGNTDSVDIAAVKIYMGKRQTGGACVPASIDQK